MNIGRYKNLNVFFIRLLSNIKKIITFLRQQLYKNDVKIKCVLIPNLFIKI